MSEVTSTNIRVGPGVYLTLKMFSENSGISMGSWANFFIVGSLIAGDGATYKRLPTEIQNALAADIMSSLGDFFKAIGMEAVRNTSISELYQNLLNSGKTKNK